VKVVRVEVLTAVTVKNVFSWDITPYVIISQKKVFFIVTAVKTSNLFMGRLLIGTYHKAQHTRRRHSS
jgi:hypothetical protein